MKGKLALLAGAAVGYVLGTRDGRQRYEQLKAKAKATINDPKVQEAATQMQHRVVDVASTAASKAREVAGDKTGRHVDDADATTQPVTPTGYPPE